MSNARSHAICGTVRRRMCSWTDVTAAILDIVRAAGAVAPPPRGVPFLSLDHPTGTPLALVEDLATRGIFRKYEHVLDLGGGLGAATRYMTTRLGCTATATARTCDEAAAGRVLTERARLEWQVHHAVADPVKLPFATAAFTHVWVLETLPTLGASTRVLVEAHRVLRPGGHLAVQEIALRTDDPTLACRGFVDAGVRQRELVAAGFVEIARRDVDVGRQTTTSRHDAGWTRLAARLGASHPFVQARQLVAEALASGRAGITQLTARRP